MADSKTCTKCGETKPLDEFGRYAKSRDGLNTSCRECKSEYDRSYRLRRFGAPPPHPDNFTPDLPPDLKRCSACRATFKRGDFNKDRNRSDGLFPQCKKCRTEYMRGYGAQEEVKERRRLWQERRRLELLEEQCCIDGCTKPPTFRKGGPCAMHRARLDRHGDAEAVNKPTPLMGTDNPQWKGRDIGYSTAHQRVRRAHGPARLRFCKCGEPAAHWAYDHSDPDELLQEVAGCAVPYSPDVDRYLPMCVPCHKEFDLAHIRGQSVDELRNELDDLTEEEIEAAIEAEIERWTD